MDHGAQHLFQSLPTIYPLKYNTYNYYVTVIILIFVLSVYRITPAPPKKKTAHLDAQVS